MIIDVIYVRFRITAIVTADVCITIEITVILSVGTWVRLPFTMEGIGICFRRNRLLG